MYKNALISKIITSIGFLLVFGTLTNCNSEAISSDMSNANNDIAKHSSLPIKMPTKNENEIEPQPTNLSEIPTLTYCDLIKDASTYDKKIVRLRAIYFNEFERTYLYDSHCEKVEQPESPEKIPAETWAEWDKSFVTEGDSDEAKMNREIKGFGRKDVTVIGRFYSTDEQNDPNAPNRFGHMNCCRFQFRIMRVEKVVILEKKVAKATYSFGTRVKYALGQKLDFADLTLEFIGERRVPVSPQSARQFVFYDFKAKQTDEEKIVSWSSGTGDIAPTKFESGGTHYQLELGISDKIGRLANNELIVWKKH